MPYRQFHDLFPDLAERETRTFIVPPGATRAALPQGEYGLVEMFCDEPDCDCRRGFLYAQSSFRPGPEAVIAWGWEPRAFFGLFTCATNTAFVPKSLLRPTDHAGQVRGLLQRRALALCGDICNLVPPPATLRAAPAPEWEVAEFPWADPVQAGEPVERFLTFRQERMKALLEQATP